MTAVAPPPRITKEDGDEDSLFLFFLAFSSDTSCFLGGTAGHKSPLPFPLPPAAAAASSTKEVYAQEGSSF